MHLQVWLHEEVLKRSSDPDSLHASEMQNTYICLFREQRPHIHLLCVLYTGSNVIFCKVNIREIELSLNQIQTNGCQVYVRPGFPERHVEHSVAMARQTGRTRTSKDNVDWLARRVTHQTTFRK